MVSPWLSVTARSILGIVDRPGRIVEGEIWFRRRAVAGRREADRVVDLAKLVRVCGLRASPLVPAPWLAYSGATWCTVVH